MSAAEKAGGLVDSGGAFDAEGIDRSPEAPGAYVLFKGRLTIFIGATGDIRGTLESHRLGEQGALTSHATSYWCSAIGISEAGMRARQLVETYKMSHNLNPPPGNRPGAIRLLSAAWGRPDAVGPDAAGSPGDRLGPVAG